MGRAPCCDKENVKKGPWSPEEDTKLKAYIEQCGTGGNWIALPQKIGLKRCGKSCRLRWLNYLRPNIKHGGFSEEEDNIICSLYISIGSRWSIIAAQLPGRTDNDIKNYWNTRLKKKLLGRRKESQVRRLSALNQDPKDANGMEDNLYSQTLSNSALERLQLHMQLQSFQNPFNFYNNPALWPKLHSLGERILQSNSGLKDSNAPQMQQLPNTQAGACQKGEHSELPSASTGLEQANSTTSNPKQGEINNSLTNFSSLESSIAFNSGSNLVDRAILSKLNIIELPNTNIQSVSSLQDELNDLLYNKTEEFIENEDQITELDCFKDIDCFKDMDCVKENMIWWGNSLDAKSSSSNSWDSASILQQEEVFQDYVLGYDP